MGQCVTRVRYLPSAGNCRGLKVEAHGRGKFDSSQLDGDPLTNIDLCSALGTYPQASTVGIALKRTASSWSRTHGEDGRGSLG
jgi:hypothetical protein